MGWMPNARQGAREMVRYHILEPRLAALNESNCPNSKLTCELMKCTVNVGVP
jgi:hypothetical protein